MHKTILTASIISLALLYPKAAMFGAPAEVAPDPADPQYQMRGNQSRTYTFPGTGESIAYHLYVPAAWSKNTSMPLLIFLHGDGQSLEAPFRASSGVLGKISEERGYIIAAPLGYRVNGDFNNPYKLVPAPPPPPGAPPPAARKTDGKAKGPDPAPLTAEDRMRSEQDVLNVTALVAKEYNTDPRRVYLMGNYMGALGTWYLGQKYPRMWAAISPSAGAMESPEQYPWDRLKGLPVAVVHSDMDARVSFDASLRMVELAKQHNLDVTWIPVKGNHFEVWGPAAAQVFDFFDQHKQK